jgi:hypothetical protein
MRFLWDGVVEVLWALSRLRNVRRWRRAFVVWPIHPTDSTRRLGVHENDGESVIKEAGAPAGKAYLDPA